MMKTWKEFELKVAQIYEKLGYAVEHDVLISGTQVDVRAERAFPGIGHQILAIECKFTEKDEPVKKRVVQEFLHFAENARSQGEVHAAVMVSNFDFTRTAKEAVAGSTALTLLTLHQLENHLFDVVAPLVQFIAAYERQRIFKSYIALSGKTDLNASQDQPSQLKDVQSTITEQVNSQTVQLTTVLADFGGGKSTLLQRLKYEYAKRYIASNIHSVITKCAC